MSSEPNDGAWAPPGAAFVAAAGGSVYYWVGSQEWRSIPPLDRLWFPTEKAARDAGFARAAEGFERLEEFEILGEIGRGGSSIVYRARDRVLGRDVAIKVIQAHFGADNDTIARFAQEARLLAGLRHPNIVSAFSVVRLNGGGLALVMEYVAGRTLREVLAKEGALPVDRAERILRDVGEALSAAHHHGIVHRDVKPDNIFLEDDTDRALLADFGIAVHLDNPSGLTIAGTAVGTPNYMSPEQIDGLKVDGRSDLYSLGLIGWELMTGEKPWANESLYSVIYKQKREQLSPLRWYREDMPAAYGVAVEGALAKDPNARWSGTEEFLRRLSPDSSGARFRVESAAILWRNKTAAKVAAASEHLEMATRAGLDTVFFRRPPPDPADAGAEPGLRKAAPYRGRRWARTAALVGIMAVGVTTLALGFRRDESGEVAAAADPTRADPSVQAELGMIAGNGPGGAEAFPGLSPLDTLLDLAFDDTLEFGDTVLPTLIISETVGGVSSPTSGAVTPGPESTPAPAAVATPAAGATTGEAGPQSPPPGTLPVAQTTARIAPGGLHTCEINVNGALSCWGGNDRGQLGTGGQRRTSLPVAVNAASGFQAVVSGGFHACALSSIGTALCWGDNRDGQLGAADRASQGPISVPGTRFFSLSLGIAHTCGVGRDGAAYCWGSNATGQLGDGSRASRAAPTRVRLEEQAAEVTAGWNHSCALTRQGRVYCWGQNDRGQLGDGTATARNNPAVVPGNLYFRGVTAGSAHTCAIATDRNAYCWGQNTDGRLGDGSTSDRNSPTLVRGGLQFTEISAGGRHTCGITSGGVAYCWGLNNYGQLGTGDTQSHLQPTRVETELRFGAIRSSGSHTCATTVDAVSYCWGYNIEGQVGDGTQTHRTTPRRVESGGGPTI